MRELVASLQQTATWCDHRDGRVYYVGELDDANLGWGIAYLNQNALELLRTRYDLDDVAVDHVSVDDALEWLHERPLYRRLLAEQRRRAAARRSSNEVLIADVDLNTTRRRLGEP